MGRASFIRELCIALEHRYEPDALFLIFTAYFDESDTRSVADSDNGCLPWKRAPMGVVWTEDKSASAAGRVYSVPR